MRGTFPVDSRQLDAPSTSSLMTTFYIDQAVSVVSNIFKAVEGETTQAVDDGRASILLDVLGDMRVSIDYCVSPISMVGLLADGSEPVTQKNITYCAYRLRNNTFFKELTACYLSCL